MCGWLFLPPGILLSAAPSCAACSACSFCDSVLIPRGFWTVPSPCPLGCPVPYLAWGRSPLSGEQPPRVWPAWQHPCSVGPWSLQWLPGPCGGSLVPAMDPWSLRWLPGPCSVGPWSPWWIPGLHSGSPGPCGGSLLPAMDPWSLQWIPGPCSDPEPTSFRDMPVGATMQRRWR